MVEITSEEQNKVKRMKRTEASLRDLWDNIKRTNIRITGVPEEAAPLQYSCLEKSHGQRSLVGYSPWGR